MDGIFSFDIPSSMHYDPSQLSGRRKAEMIFKIGPVEPAQGNACEGKSQSD